jgi:hypothetical protein
MDLSKLKNGQKIILGAGILLIINLFLPWYHWGAGVAGYFGVSVSWNAFHNFWSWFGSFCAIAAAVIIALKVFANMKITAGALKAEHIALALSALGFLFILIGLLTNTSFLFVGVFIGLIISAGLAYGAFMAMKEEGLALNDFKALGGGGTPPPPPPPPA